MLLSPRRTTRRFTVANLICSRFRTLTDAGYDCGHAVVLAVHPHVDLAHADSLRKASSNSGTAAVRLIQQAA